MIVGIDLGTTNSLIGIWHSGRPALIPNALGQLLTPSAVSVGNEGDIHYCRSDHVRAVGALVSSDVIVRTGIDLMPLRRGCGRSVISTQSRRRLMKNPLVVLLLSLGIATPCLSASDRFLADKPSPLNVNTTESRFAVCLNRFLQQNLPNGGNRLPDPDVAQKHRLIDRALFAEMLPG
jgi:hypothetical protein